MKPSRKSVTAADVTIAESTPGFHVRTAADTIVARNGRQSIARSTALSAIRPIPRRGLSRVEAAMYIGVGTSKFDELVRHGRMPGPKRIDRRLIWDICQLDVAFDALPSDSGPEDTSWDDFENPAGARK